MNKKLLFEKLRELSKEVCLNMCPHALIECPENCKFQKILIEIVAELSK